MGWEPHYDEDGNHHNHNPNKRTNGYKCSNGHEWQTVSKQRCPNAECDYGEDE